MSMSDRSDETGQKPETPGSGGPAPAPEEPNGSGPAPTPETPGPLPNPETETSADPAETAALPIPDDTPTLPTRSPFAAPATEPIVPVHWTDPADRTALLDHPGGSAFLTARDLTANGRQGPIFTDVTVTAHLGQLVAVCGDGGDGRTSLLLALTGRFRHQHGTLQVDGQTKPGQIRRRFTISQAGPPIRFEPYATVAACINETVTVSNGAATRANISAWLDRLAVGVDRGDTFGFLPRIDQIRFAIACAAAGRTPAIAVDDADTGLDTRGAERVFEALRTVADAGQLVIAACTRADPPADTVVDLRDRPPAPARPPRRKRTRNGGLR
jgi:energy-coupling factor transporter ATP-binding protein EcfA2